MAKRKREEGENSNSREPPTKRSRATGKNHFLDLSDELVLRTLSFLSIQDLTKAERICTRFKRLASDNEIWKEKYYIRFVRPRARRIPAVGALTHSERENNALHYASKSARWLEHNAPSRDGLAADWKRRYKIKLNWTKGRCNAHEVTLDCPYQPRILVKICNGAIHTADERRLSLYSQRSRPQILQRYYWEKDKRPTSMAVGAANNSTYIAVGFAGGSLQVLQTQGDSYFPVLDYDFLDVNDITSLALVWPYILTMSSDHQMHLMEVNTKMPSHDRGSMNILSSLKSDASLQPVSLSIRKTSDTLIASIAYSFSRLNAGWCLGLQEIRLSLAGTILGSRLTSSVDTPMHDFPLRKRALSSRSTSTAPFALHPNLMNPPTSISHSGCYVLAGLPDNTLMVYTIISSTDKLEVSAGRRLFGHTSSISGAEVSDRGKALSISARGGEIRVWELEDLLSSWSAHKTSTRLQPRYSPDDLHMALAKRGTGLGLALKETKEESTWNRHWVGFDDEQVVVLGERDERQILSCYDFA